MADKGVSEMKKPNEEQSLALKKKLPAEVVAWFRTALAHEDKDNRRLQGEDAAEGRGRAQIFENILKEVDGATVPPA